MIARFFSAAEVVAVLLEESVVAERWEEPSALAGMSTGAVAAHLAGQAGSLLSAWSVDVGDLPVVDVVEHYRRSRWRQAPQDPANDQILASAEAAASVGAVATAASFRHDVASVEEAARSGVPDVVRMPWWDWAVPFDSLVVIRLLELVVHSDDLAASVGLPGREFGAAVVDPVFSVLTRLAAEQHGESAVLRHLARRERAQGSIAVL